VYLFGRTKSRIACVASVDTLESLNHLMPVAFLPSSQGNFPTLPRKRKTHAVFPVGVCKSIVDGSRSVCVWAMRRTNNSIVIFVCRNGKRATAQRLSVGVRAFGVCARANIVGPTTHAHL
jgi:hypothetical protein